MRRRQADNLVNANCVVAENGDIGRELPQHLV
jgi:hypothetical protein